MDCKDLQIRLIAVLRHQMHAQGAMHGTKFHDYRIAQMIGMSGSNFSNVASGVQLIDTEHLRQLLRICNLFVSPASTIDQIVEEWIDTCPLTEDAEGMLHKYFDTASDSHVEFQLRPDDFGCSKNQ